jgi:hypothetical protein
MAHPVPATIPGPESAYDTLSEKRRLFVDEYLIDLNARRAAVKAGFTVNMGRQLLEKPVIQEALRELREQTATERHANGGEFVLNRLWDTATADARELIEVYRVPCRYCWGINGQYQWTLGELQRLSKAHKYGRSKQPYEALWPKGPADFAYYTMGFNDIEFDELGGEGYTTKRDPNPECCECHGEGVVTQHFTDTRKLSASARALYRGAKITGNGIEIMLANQDEARNLLARHYNVGVERKQLLVGSIDPRELSDEELVRAQAQVDAMILELETTTETRQVEISQQRRATTIRHTRQVSAARMRAARNGQTMIQRPRG